MRISSHILKDETERYKLAGSYMRLHEMRLSELNYPNIKKRLET